MGLGGGVMNGRRRFLGLMAGASGAVTARAKEEEAKPKLMLGYDNYAVRAMKWKAPALIDYAVKLQVDSLFITDLDAFESLEDKALAELRKQAEGGGVKLFLGSWSICPSSKSFRDTWGSADEHLALGIRAAKALGSPVFRVVLGAAKDRTTDGGIEARIEDTVAVLKRSRSRALDAGVKVAVENHAGDLHSLELKLLIEAAGPEFVGANLDAGNAMWCFETPMQNLENLGKYVLTTSLRDSAVWESQGGVTVQWTAMGEGMVDWKAYFARFAELCPEAPVNIETISGFNRELAFSGEGFEEAWPKGRPAGFEGFLAMAKKGTPRPAWSPPEGGDRQEAERAYQRGEIERSLAYCRSIGLGRNA